MILDKVYGRAYYKHINSCSYVRKKEGEKLSEAELECCEGVEIHQDRLKIVSDQMPEEEELYDLGISDFDARLEELHAFLS